MDEIAKFKEDLAEARAKVFSSFRFLKLYCMLVSIQDRKFENVCVHVYMCMYIFYMYIFEFSIFKIVLYACIYSRSKIRKCMCTCIYVHVYILHVYFRVFDF